MAVKKIERSKIGPLPFTLGGWAARLVSLFIVALIVILLLPYGLKYVEGTDQYSYIQKLNTAHDWTMETLGGKVRQYVPTTIAGEDRTLWVLVFGLFVANVFVARASASMRARGDYLRLKRKVEEWESEMGLEEDSEMATELNAQLARLKEGKKEDREELLRIFAETKRKLSGMGRELAFLSIDIVDSTKMKIGEDQQSVEYDFKQYKNFVDEIFQANGVLKTAWTPDGVMACFSNIDTAVKAGKDVIRGLDHFNHEVKLMKADFVVRCGVNAGYVYMDDSVPLEEVSDRVIDIAGHMQKHAEPNTVSVAKKVVEPLSDRGGFRETAKVVDGYEVFAWTKGDEAPAP